LAKLILNPQMPSRKEIDLPKADLSIGRDPTNDVVIPDALVSRRHARIVYDGREYCFLDCESSNGSLLNGDRVSERTLHDGDVLWLGASRLLFRAPELQIDGSSAKIIQHPSAQRLRCHACDHAYQGGDVFCRHCGAGLDQHQSVVLCGGCGARVIAPAAFCTACGDALAAKGTRGSARRRNDRPSSTETYAIEEQFSAATAEKRLLAALVDFLANAALFALFSLPPLGLYIGAEDRTSLAAWLMLLPALSFPAYYVGFWATRSATPGKELLGLSIQMKNADHRFGLAQAFVRFGAFCVSLATMGLGFMLILADGETLHDRIARTRVVERRS
jgi:uncharacterized RDD family membrane protein YckC